MKITFENKVALVTGAGGGLGLATAKAFAEAGASVALVDYDEKLVTKAAADLAAKGFNTLAICCDVTNDAQVEAMVKRTVEKFGRLDCAYNNAGVQNALKGAADQTREDFDRVIGTNLRGVWSCMKFELQQMRKQGNGSIVNCSSLGGIRGGSMRGTYHASKYGIVGLTTSAAIEYAPMGIRINAVLPGLFMTPMAQKMIDGGQKEALDQMAMSVPIGRMGKAEEIADAVLWLSSERATYMVGHALVVDGGFTI
jgi:NAD(P)-dependent dehydrogenase (short-subunit alcohol dehydrogenase family)